MRSNGRNAAHSLSTLGRGSLFLLPAVQVAQAYKLIGDVRAKTGNQTAAQAAWQAALMGWPKGLNDPRNIALRAEILTALGRDTEARPLKSRLEAIGYRRLI